MQELITMTVIWMTLMNLILNRISENNPEITYIFQKTAKN